jgi:hypothetical protein
MNFFKWNACHYKQDILNQIDLIRPRTGNILVIVVTVSFRTHPFESNRNNNTGKKTEANRQQKTAAKKNLMRMDNLL